jgi:PncC family amidohydrolase
LVIERLKRGGISVILAESCTGGLVSKLLTDVPGSSAVVWGGIVAYSNAAKERLLSVPGRLIREKGAVSRETAQAMAKGALESSGCALAIALTGIAGPDGGGPDKPVGTVFIAAAATGGRSEVRGFLFEGGRDEIRRASAEAAFDMIESFS